MYILKAFREDDTAVLHELMQEYSFAILVTQHDTVPLASHLPFVLDTSRGSFGTLRSHMARANWQWHDFDGVHEALTIFQGPHAYISPSWYEVELSVPTWNYAAVHAYGVPCIIEDKQEVYEMLKSLIQKHEARFERPWPSALPDDYVQKMIAGTVGFEMEITRLEGKFKLSQNRSKQDQAQVIAALDEYAVADVAELMRKRLNK